MFDYQDYLSWVRYREEDIYKLIDLVFSNDTSKKQFLLSIWDRVLLIDQGLNNKELNYLLFSHYLILNSRYIDPGLFDKYGIGDLNQSFGYLISSVSDTGTSVSSQASKALSNLSLIDQEYMLTPFGVQYLNLLTQLQTMSVIL